MTNRKTTKHALIASFTSLLLCFTMLLGTTFAWFMDSASTGRNVIQAGSLNVVLEYKTDWADEWEEVDEQTKLFKEGALYEPGYTEIVYLRVSNAGNLALKYNLDVILHDETPSTNINGEPLHIKEFLEIGYYVQDEYSSGANYADILMPYMFGSRDTALSNVTTTKLSDFSEGIINVKSNAPVLPGDDTAQVIAIVLTMPMNVGNDANALPNALIPSVELGVRLLATQLQSEYDSYGNNYDAGAEYPDFRIPEIISVEGNNKAAVMAAIANANDGDTVKLTADTTIAGYTADNKLVIEKAITLDLNGKTLTTECGWGGIDLKGGASIVNGTIYHTGNTAAIKAFQVGKIENVIINVTETAGKTKGGIVVQDGSSSVGTIKNVTINGATNGIECYRSAGASSIGSIVNVTINATANGIYLNGAGQIGLISDCKITGGNIGINAYLANLWHISLDIKNSEIKGGTSGIDIWDETGATNGGSTVTLTYDSDTTFEGATNDIKVTLQEEITCTINGESITTPCDKRIND